MLARKSRVVKKHMSFCRELSMLCVEDGVLHTVLFDFKRK